MELWLDAILIVLLALFFDRFVGEVPNCIHPLRWIGITVDWFDRRLKNRSSKLAKLWGFTSYLLITLIFAFIALTVTMLPRIYLADYSYNITDEITITLGEIIWIILTAYIFKISFAIFSFRAHCKPIQADIRNGNIDAATDKLQMIVSRKTAGMDVEHINSSCCETISENLVDSVISPTFFFGLFGMGGAVMFRCANLMDAMWGYLNDKYGKIGFFPAKFDDVLGYFTSRISPIFVVLGSKLRREKGYPIIEAARKEHTKTPSPNSGWSMTAIAAALGISMEKKDVYVMGEGPMPTVDDVTRCYKLVECTSILFVLLITLPLYVLLGVHLQVGMENLIYDLIEMII